MPTAVIMTALQVEYLAVRAHLSGLREEQERGTVYEVGSFVDGDHAWEVAIAQVGAGNAPAAVQTERAIAHFGPDAVLFVGVAGGIKDVRLGDVVAATKVYGYESGRAAEMFLPRPDVGRSSHGLVQRAMAVARGSEWQRRIDPIVGGPAAALVGPIAAGEKVVADTAADTYWFLRASYGDALAVEMEGRGFAEAAYANDGLPALVVRGISDLIADKGQADAAGFQAVAARHAAAFAFEILAKLDVAPAVPAPDHVPPSDAVSGPRVEPRPDEPIGNVPHRRNPNFVGREDLLVELRSALVAGEATALTQAQAIHGLGGVGKTQLAVEYAYRHAPDYDVVWWVRCQDPATLGSDFSDLARVLGLPEEAADHGTAVGAALRWLDRTAARWLLVFDSADRPDDLSPYLRRAGSGHLVITSRNPAWGRVAHPFPLGGLPPDEATAFLLRRSARDQTAGEGERLAAAELAAESGFLPLALEQAAAFVEETGESFEAYLRLFRERRVELLAEGAPPPEEYPATVLTTWELAFRRVEEEDPAAADFLRLCAFLAADGIPRDVLAEHTDQLSQPLAATFADPLATSWAVRSLRRYSLVEVVDDRTLSVHRLVQAVTQFRMSREVQHVWATAAVTLVDAAFPFDCGEVGEWPRCERLVAHALAATSHVLHLGVANDAAGRLLSRVGVYLHSRAQFDEARRAHELALAIQEATLGPEHPAVAIDLNNLAEVLRAQNDHAGAYLLLERASLILGAQPDAHQQVEAKVLNNQALVLKHWGDLSGAQHHLELAVALLEAILGPDHPDVAMALANLASVLHERGDLDGAQGLLERTVRIREASLGPDHPDVAHSLNSLAGVLWEKGDLDGAGRLFERALALAEQSYGPNHPAVASCLGNVAGVHRDRGDPDGAGRLFERALAIDEQVYGRDHPSVGVALNNLAGVLWRQGNLVAAIERYQRAAAILAASLGPGHDKTEAAVRSLAEVLHQHGDPAGARRVLERHVAACEAAYGSANPIVAHVLNILAGELRAQGDLAGAQQQLERAVALHQTALGPDHPGLAGLLKNLGMVLSEAGDCADSRRSLERALVIAEAALEPQVELVASIREGLASLPC